MKSVRFLSILVLTLIVLGVTAMASAQEVVQSYTEWAEAGSPVLPTVGSGTPGPTTNFGGLTFYTDRGTFQGGCGQPLALEDFSNTLVPPNGVLGCDPGPLNSATNNNCFATGGVIDGFTLSSSIPAEDLVVITPPFLGVTKVTVGPNTFGDDSEFAFSPAVDAVGVEIVGPLANFTVDIEVFDASDNSLGTTTSPAGLPASFWGVTSTIPIGRIVVTDPLGGAELYSDLEFGSCAVDDPLAIPTLGWQAMLIMMLGLGLASFFLMRRS